MTLSLPPQEGTPAQPDPWASCPSPVTPLVSPSWFDLESLVFDALEVEKNLFDAQCELPRGMDMRAQTDHLRVGEGSDALDLQPLPNPPPPAEVLSSRRTHNSDQGCPFPHPKRLRVNPPGEAIGDPMPSFDRVEAFVSREHRARRLKRQRKSANPKHLAAAADALPAPRTVKNTLSPAINRSIKAPLNLSELPAASCGFQAVPLKVEEDVENLEELMAQGYTLVPWDGCEARPLINKSGIVFAVLAGRPKGSSYQESCRLVYEAFAEEAQADELQEEAGKNRRGEFAVLNVGVTHGKGTQEPVNLHANRNGQPSLHGERLQRLLDSPHLRRIAGFASSAFKLWAPKLYGYYLTTLENLWERSPRLHRIFNNSIFPCAALNFGPRVWTRRHRDSMNLPFGWCAVTSFGNFDHKKGGHFVLPDLKLVIEFPSGATVLIPSATLTHANVPVQPHETRASFAQFCAGGLFRFVETGFTTEKALQKKNKKEHARICALKAGRWEKGLQLFSNLKDVTGGGSSHEPFISKDSVQGVGIGR